jgi:RNA recognition motif-containing protein
MASVVRLSELDERVTKDVIVAFCSSFGDIKTVDVSMDNLRNVNKGHAYVEFFEAQDAADCVDNLDLADLYGKTVRVAIAADRQTA